MLLSPTDSKSWDSTFCRRCFSRGTVENMRRGLRGFKKVSEVVRRFQDCFCECFGIVDCADVQRCEAVNIFQIDIRVEFHKNFDTFDRISDDGWFGAKTRVMKRRLKSIVLNVWIRSILQKKLQQINITLNERKFQVWEEKIMWAKSEVLRNWEKFWSPNFSDAVDEWCSSIRVLNININHKFAFGACQRFVLGQKILYNLVLGCWASEVECSSLENVC